MQIRVENCYDNQAIAAVLLKLPRKFNGSIWTAKLDLYTRKDKFISEGDSNLTTGYKFKTTSRGIFGETNPGDEGRVGEVFRNPFPLPLS